jgi:hypothetical protein
LLILNKLNDPQAQNKHNKAHPPDRDKLCLDTIAQETLVRGTYVTIFSTARMKRFMSPEKLESS